MAKNTQNIQPVVNAPQSASEAATEAEGTIRHNNSLFGLARSGASQNVQDKVRFMGDIRQKLAEVADTAREAGDQAAETETLAGTAATRLFLARRDGLVNGEELTGLLGDVFGYKPKQDGTPGKTPAGTGEAIRKRIVRAMQGWDFINGGDGGRFFETMDADEVAPVINSIGRTKTVKHTAEDGTVTEEIVSDGPTVWHAYKLLGDIKSQGTVRLPFAFDAKKIVGLTDSLSEAGARDKLLANPALLKAYGGLMDQLRIIDEVDENEVETVKAALGLASDEEADETGEQMAA